MGAHTKGPWGVASAGWGNGSESGGRIDAIRPTGRYTKNGDEFVPEMAGVPVRMFFTNRLDDGEGRANARLIASAPDLLEAATVALEDLYKNADIAVNERPSVRALRAAIRKATGEA